MANKKYKLTDGNMWATDGIHDFGQNKTQRTINSEVNSALGGKAPTNHASTSTTYGKGTSSNYGHVKISDSLTDTTPAATGGVVPSMKAVSDLNGALNAITPLDTTPTANSTKGVTSSGVFNALPKEEAVEWFTANTTYVTRIDPSFFVKRYGKVIVLVGGFDLTGNVPGVNADLGVFNNIKPGATQRVYCFGTYDGVYGIYSCSFNSNGHIYTNTGSKNFTGQIFFPNLALI